MIDSNIPPFTRGNNERTAARLEKFLNLSQGTTPSQFYVNGTFVKTTCSWSMPTAVGGGSVNYTSPCGNNAKLSVATCSLRIKLKRPTSYVYCEIQCQHESTFRLSIQATPSIHGTSPAFLCVNRLTLVASLSKH